MQPTLCSRCKKNIATVFITRMEGDKTVNEGLCLKCAKEPGTAPGERYDEAHGHHAMKTWII